MKIAHISRQFYPAVGGIETAVLHLSQNLQSAGHQVHVVTLNRLFGRKGHHLPLEERVNGILVRRVPYWGSRRYAVAPTALRFANEYDLIHLHSTDFFLDYFAWTKPIHRKPLVLSSHGLFFHTPFARTLKRVYFHTVTRINLRQVSAIICVSQHDFQLLSQVAPVEKLCLIPNGIEYEKLSTLGTNNRDRDLLIGVGRLATNKRYDRVLRAFSRVVKRRPTARLVIIGPDQGHIVSLQELCVELGIAKQVEFLGRIPEDELLNYLSRANVWLSASSYEAFGIALLEAMTAGCIPVVHPLPSFKQLLGGGEGGFYADFERPDQASQVILQALSLSPQERENKAASARATASRFSWSAIAERTQRVYATVAAPDAFRSGRGSGISQWLLKKISSDY